MALPFFGIGMKTDLFQSCGHCWVFQICWHIKCSTFTVSSFSSWNSSTGIPSPPLALFIVMLSKAHLTSHSRMSRSRRVIMPLWLSGLWRSFFVQFFCIFLPSLLNIFCFCYVHTISVLYWAHLCINYFIFAWNVLTKRDPLEKGMANHFSILALWAPWTVWKSKK